MAKRAKVRTETETGTVEQFFDEASCEVESLIEEMESWRDNLAGANMEHLPKYEEVDECCTCLEEARELQSIEIPDIYKELEVTAIQHIKPKMPRWMRCSNSAAQLRAIHGVLEPKVKELLSRADDIEGAIQAGADTSGPLGTVDDAKAKRAEGQELDGIVRALDEALQGLESASFPGMF